mmetsp:Transcript_48296/g.105111  ORF Transcript_48296/g.105111 Transcript_48296/m.105111 type:complete len:247 (-) Transcript_48296:16-756(-)
MFRLTAQTLMRRAPCAVAAAGVTLAAPPLFQPHSFCDSLPGVETKVNFGRVSKTVGGPPTSVAKKFLTVYFAEYHNDENAIDLTTEVDLDTMKKLMEASGGKATDVEQMFDLMDTDNSKSVDYGEIVAYFCTQCTGTLQDKASLFFHACDVDSSNTIEKKELKSIVLHMMQLTAARNGVAIDDGWSKAAFVDIPEVYVLHFKANALVQSIFTGASRKGEELTEKEFQRWMTRGGKEVNRLTALFGL